VMLVFDVIKLEVNNEENKKLNLSGKATFLHIPQVAKALEGIEIIEGEEIVLDLSNVQYLDNVIKDEVNDWVKEVESKKGKAKVIFPDFC